MAVLISIQHLDQAHVNALVIIWLPHPKIVITGFNTDIEHNGVVYHVQTEDKGLDTPLILSLVYTGGEILASKRSPYEDLIAAGFDETLLAQRVKRQHRLICAAINAGRIDDLKKMSGRTADPAPVAPPVPPVAPAVVSPRHEIVDSQEAVVDQPPVVEDMESLIVSNAYDFEAMAEAMRPREPEKVEPPAPPEPEPEPAEVSLPRSAPPQSAYTVHDSRRQSPLGEMSQTDKGVAITILDEQHFRAGQVFNIRVMVENRSGSNWKALGGVPLSVKILGTTFRPQLYSVKTGRDGVAVVSAQIPRFTSGRAAILIRAEADGKSVEMRRVIHPAL